MEIFLVVLCLAAFVLVMVPAALVLLVPGEPDLVGATIRANAGRSSSAEPSAPTGSVAGLERSGGEPIAA